MQPEKMPPHRCRPETQLCQGELGPVQQPRACPPHPVSERVCACACVCTYVCAHVCKCPHTGESPGVWELPSTPDLATGPWLGPVPLCRERLWSRRPPVGHLPSAATPSAQKTPTVNLGQGALVSSAHAGSYALRRARRSPPNWVKPANSKGNWCVGQGRHKGTRGRGQRSGPPSDRPQWATCTAHEKHATRPPGLRLAATPHPPLGEEDDMAPWREGWTPLVLSDDTPGRHPRL